MLLHTREYVYQRKRYGEVHAGVVGTSISKTVFSFIANTLTYLGDIEEDLGISNRLRPHRIEDGDLVRAAMASAVHRISPIVMLACNARDAQ